MLHFRLEIAPAFVVRGITPFRPYTLSRAGTAATLDFKSTTPKIVHLRTMSSPRAPSSRPLTPIE